MAAGLSARRVNPSDAGDTPRRRIVHYHQPPHQLLPEELEDELLDELEDELLDELLPPLMSPNPM
jgi:Fic family protein